MSPIATTNRGRLGITRESSFAVVPSNPVFQTLRITSSGLKGSPQTIISDELISDRQVGDLVLVGKDIGGDIGFELSGVSHDLLIEAALFSAWVKLSERFNSPTSGGITAVASTTYTVAASAAPTGLGAFAQNDIIVATGFTNPANNKTFVAGAGTTSTSLVHTGGVVETPPATARVKKIGVAGASADIVAAVTPTRLTSTALNFITAGFVPGMWVKVGSASAAANAYGTTVNNGWCRVLTVAATSLVFDIVPAGFAADAGAGKTIWLQWGDYIRNGVTLYSHTLEQAYLDNAQFQYFMGMCVNMWSLAVEAKQIVKGMFGFLGGDSQALGAAIAGATNWSVNPATDVINAASNVARLSENGVPITGPNYVLGVKLDVNNNLRAQEAVASLGAVGVGMGQAVISGTLTTFFGDIAILNKALGNTATSVDFNLKDAAGYTLLFDLPKVKLSSGDATLDGKNQDVTVECGFQALKHATLGYTIHVQKVEAVS